MGRPPERVARRARWPPPRRRWRLARPRCKTAQVSRREAERRPSRSPSPARPRHARTAEPVPAEPAAKAAAREPTPAAEPVAANLTGASLTVDELCAASGLGATEVAALEGFGLIEPLVVGGVLYYDEEGLTVAKLVADFARFGIEPRHLRLFRNAGGPGARADRAGGDADAPPAQPRGPSAGRRRGRRAVPAGPVAARAILRRSLRQHFGG